MAISTTEMESSVKNRHPRVMDRFNLIYPNKAVIKLCNKTLINSRKKLSRLTKLTTLCLN